MKNGFIYCISNPSFKADIYKIGFTTQNLQKRILSLYKTGVPTKFEIIFAKMVKRCRETEHEIHVKLKKLRVNPSREFFLCPLKTIKGVFDKVEGEWWTNPEEEHAIKNKEREVKKRRRLYRKAKHSKLNYKV
jgi:hypothetical protein